jgi:SAM-dependent methyltransferase
MKSTDIKQNIKEAYGSIAKSKKPCGCGCGLGKTDTDTFAKSLGYSDKELSGLPEGANMALSCGNPTAIASLNEGETVLDLGSGGGFDCFIAAKKVGPAGHVIGVDMTPEMIKRAQGNAKKNGIQNVEFKLGDIEALPIEDNSVDVVISNCVINLAADKQKVFSEIKRVLKPGGRVAISDIVVTKELPENVRNDIAAYTGCVAGALTIDEYERLVRDAGFDDVKLTLSDLSHLKGSLSDDPIVKKVSGTVGEDDSIWDYVASAYVTAKA